MPSYRNQTFRFSPAESPINNGVNVNFDDIFTRFNFMIDVKAFGAVGDGTTDDTAAIQAAFDSIPAAVDPGYAVNFPTGNYRVTAKISVIGKNFSIIGCGGISSNILVDFDSDTVLSIDMTGASNNFVSIRGMSFRQNGNRSAVTLIKYSDAGTLLISDLVTKSGGTHIDFAGNNLIINNAEMSVISGQIIRHRHGGGWWENIHSSCPDYRGSGLPANKPPVHIGGGTDVSSIQVSNSSFGGFGYTLSSTISTIVSTANDFTVTTSASHSLAVGDHIYIAGTGVASYIGSWEVSSVPSGTTFKVATTINPGNSSGGTLSLSPMCIYFDNSTSAVDETSWSNVLFEGIDAGADAENGTTSVYIDGNRSSSVVALHKFSNCFYDMGHVGVVAVGRDAGSGESTIKDISFVGATISAVRAGFIFDFVRNARIISASMESQHNKTTVTGEYSSSAGVLLDGRHNGSCSGIIIGDSFIGRNRDWDSGGLNRAFIYGIWLRGGAPTSLIVTGSQIYGVTEAIHSSDSLTVASGLWKMEGNNYGTGGTAEDSSDQIQSIASAGTITLPLGGDIFVISGTTTINTISNGWVGRFIKLYTSSAVQFTGGNVSNTISTGAGDMVCGIFDGTNWHLVASQTGSAAPVGSAYVTIGSDSTLTGERALTGTSNQIVITDNGAGGTVVLSAPQNLHTAATPTFASETLTATTNQMVLGTTRTVTITAPTPASSSRTHTVPDITGNGTFAFLEGTQTFSGAKTFTGGITVSGSTFNVPQPSNNAYFALDNTSSTSQTVANGGTTITPFSNANNFSGLVLVNTPDTGGTALFIMSSAASTLIAQIGSTFSATQGTASKLNVYQTGGGVITIENNTATNPSTVSVMGLRVRSVA